VISKQIISPSTNIITTNTAITPTHPTYVTNTTTTNASYLHHHQHC
jgi:hypothetical protein